MSKIVRPFLLATLLSLTVTGLSLADTPAPASTAVKSAAAKSHHKTKKSLAAEANISEADARITAQAQVPTGIVKDFELEKEHGKLIYSYEFAVPNVAGITEVNINAMDGSLVNVEHEKAKAEGKEEKSDSKPGS